MTVATAPGRHLPPLSPQDEVAIVVGSLLGTALDRFDKLLREYEPLAIVEQLLRDLDQLDPEGATESSSVRRLFAVPFDGYDMDYVTPGTIARLRDGRYTADAREIVEDRRAEIERQAARAMVHESTRRALNGKIVRLARW